MTRNIQCHNSLPLEIKETRQKREVQLWKLD